VADLTGVRRLTAVAILFGAASVAAALAIQDETYDEPWHLSWSRRLWDTGETERRSDLLYNSKAPISLLNVAAEKLARAAGAEGPRTLLTAARLPGLGFYALVVALTFALARRLAGEWAGLAAAAAVAIDPNVVAHASLATVDVPFAAATLLVVLAALSYAETPDLPRAIALGAALGLAFVTKYTAILFVPVVLVALLIPHRRRAFRAIALHALAACLVAIVLIGLAYLGSGLFRRLDSLGLRSGAARAAAAALPGLRLPLPADFLTGFDIVQHQERSHPWDVNLFGPGRGPGVSYYFAACWALKTPLALAAAVLVGIGRLARRRPTAAVLAVAAIFVFLLGLLSFRLQAQIGYRLALMLVPLGLVLAAAGWADASERLRGRGLVLVAALAALESLPYLGNSLAFTNSLVLPKREAFRYLAGSNLDWGQNDAKLGEWMRTAAIAPSALEPPHLQPGVNVFSVNSLAGLSSPRRLRWARERLTPFEHFRHTHVRLEVSPADYERYLAEDRTLPADAEGACPAPASLEPIPGAWTRLPDSNATWLLCIESAARGDLTIEGRRGAALLGQADLERRDWERLRPGGSLGYRVEPGVRTLLVFVGGQLELRFALPEGARVSGRVHAARWREP